MLIAGGGVAGLETLLALRALASDRVDITLLAPELKFVNRSMAVDQPFRSSAGAASGWRRPRPNSALAGTVEHSTACERNKHPWSPRLVTSFPMTGSCSPWVHAPGATGDRRGCSPTTAVAMAPSYRLLLHQLREGLIDKVAYVRPAGASWPLPLYDLALLTAAECAAHKRSEVELSLITPEEEPLGIFGKPASTAIRRLLDEAGVTLHTGSYGIPNLPGGWTSPPATVRWR